MPNALVRRAPLATPVADDGREAPQTHQMGALLLEAVHAVQYPRGNAAWLAEHLLGGQWQVMQDAFAGGAGRADDAPEIGERHQVAWLPQVRLVAAILLGECAVEQVDDLHLALQRDGSRVSDKAEFHGSVSSVFH